MRDIIKIMLIVLATIRCYMCYNAVPNGSAWSDFAGEFVITLFMLTALVLFHMPDDDNKQK